MSEIIENNSVSRSPFFISAPRHLEPLLLEELLEMGIEGAKAGHLGAEVELSLEEAYRVVYGSRIASRLLRPIAEFECRDPEELYEYAYSLPWTQIIQSGQTFRISAHTAYSTIDHSQYAALKLKDAIVDHFRDQEVERPNVEMDSPDLRFDLVIFHNVAKISLYYSDGVMHRRGYRKLAVSAPMKENLAAAVLRFAKWKGVTPLVDPFCGSGTFLIEAAMLYTKTPAGFFRTRQGFEGLPDFDEELWLKVKTEMDAAIIPLPHKLIQGGDNDPKAVEASILNLSGTPFADQIQIFKQDFKKWEKFQKYTTVISNPPYGLRLEGENPKLLETTYAHLGMFLKSRCPGSKTYVLMADPLWEKALHLKSHRHMLIDNGQLEVRVHEYKIPTTPLV